MASALLGLVLAGSMRGAPSARPQHVRRVKGPQAGSTTYRLGAGTPGRSCGSVSITAKSKNRRLVPVAVAGLHDAAAILAERRDRDDVVKGLRNGSFRAVHEYAMKMICPELVKYDRATQVRIRRNLWSFPKPRSCLKLLTITRSSGIFVGE